MTDQPAPAAPSTVLPVTADLAVSGHGHVVPRNDGMLARCGGPGMCARCDADKARLDRAIAAEAAANGLTRVVVYMIPATQAALDRAAELAGLTEVSTIIRAVNLYAQMLELDAAGYQLTAVRRPSRQTTQTIAVTEEIARTGTFTIDPGHEINLNEYLRPTTDKETQQ